MLINRRLGEGRGEGTITEQGADLSLRSNSLPPASPSSFSLTHANLNLIVDDAHFVGGDLETRVVAPGSILDRKPPGMPGARNGAALVDLARAKRGAHMRAEIVDGEILTMVDENCHQVLADLERTALPFSNGVNSGDGDIVRHARELVWGIQQLILNDTVCAACGNRCAWVLTPGETGPDIPKVASYIAQQDESSQN